MIKDITIGQYIPGETFVHKLDPRTKILLTILYIISLFIVDKFVGYILIIGFLVLTVWAAKLPVRYLAKGIKPVLFLIIFTAVLNIFMVKGTLNNLIFEYGFIKVYKEGLLTAAFMALRLIFLIMSTSVLTLTTSPIELTDAIEKLLKPIGKEIAHELAMMMTIALRFIPTLMDETDKIMMAQKARGADFDNGGLMQKAKSLIPLLVPLFVSSFRRADELAMAMESRAYRGGAGRTRMKQLKFTNNDLLSFGLFSILFVGALLVRFYL
ncbi:energy-coupling factor transporter transmembrane component T family protein [Clostridium isatidis]|uniref:Energy-coupling factor transporter transmembrane protein EcfT n=1 Tax=Clostridium isatidis TaxID=182773 RepID=A0A343J9H8_9CLOT|nr:energy-coupling factor transporter transmembrane component T [Clostridium isatidis]ASW42186.1 transporter [Clostridium isatidis]